MSKENIDLQPSKELAYWVGVAQSDGCLSRDHKEGGSYRIVLETSRNSLPMLFKFKELSEYLFVRKLRILKKRTRGTWYCTLYMSKLLKIFETLDISFNDPPEPPEWVIKSISLFGAYLAGLIDGDGSVTVKRPKYPQCYIRITSGKSQDSLKSAVKSLLRCGASIAKRSGISTIDGRKIYGKWYDLGFLVSSKTSDSFKKHILPHLQLAYKRRIIETYISSRWSNN